MALKHPWKPVSLPFRPIKVFALEKGLTDQPPAYMEKPTITVQPRHPEHPTNPQLDHIFCADVPLDPLPPSNGWLENNPPSTEPVEATTVTKEPRKAKPGPRPEGFSVPAALTMAEHVRTQEHYARFEIEPIDFVVANKLGYREGNIIKYVCRHPYKGQQLRDLYNARDYLDRIITSVEEAK